MNVFTYLYFQLYLALDKFTPFKVTRFKVLIVMAILQFLNLALFVEVLSRPFATKIGAPPIVKIILEWLLMVGVFVANYSLLDFDSAEREAVDETSKVSWKFLAYLLATLITYLAFELNFFASEPLIANSKTKANYHILEKMDSVEAEK